MSGIWGVVQIVGVAWFAASVVIAVAWALGGKRIFRKYPESPADRSNVQDIDARGGER